MSINLSGIIERLTSAVDSLDVTNIDWLDFIASRILGPLGTAMSAIEWVMDSEQFAGFATSVKDALASIEWLDLAESLGGLVLAVGDNIVGIGTGMVASAAEKINAVDWSVLSLDFAGMLTSITDTLIATDWSSIGEALGSAVAGIFSGGEEGESPFGNLGTAVRDALAAIEWLELGSAFAGLVVAVGDAIVGAFAGFAEGVGLDLEFVEIDWESFVTALDWGTFVTAMGWGDFVSEVSWNDFVSNLSWTAFVSKISWKSFVPKINWGDFIPSWLRPGANATGTNYWQGGLTWVGEFGPELVQLPRGTEILNRRESTQTGGYGGVTVQAMYVRSDSDIQRIAQELAFYQRQRGS